MISVEVDVTDLSHSLLLERQHPQPVLRRCPKAIALRKSARLGCLKNKRQFSLDFYVYLVVHMSFLFVFMPASRF